MVVEDFIEGLWVNVALEIRVTNAEEEVEIVRLLAVLVIAFRHDSHYFSKPFDLFNQGHFASQVHHAADRYRLEEEDLVDSG